MTRKWAPPDVDQFLQLYDSGISARALAVTYDVALSTVQGALQRYGATLRDQSSAGILRASRESDSDRTRMNASRSAALLGRPRTPAMQAAIAIGKQRHQVKIGLGEEPLGRWLAARGLKTAPQLAVGPYNLDLAAFPVDIEVHNTTHSPQSCGPRVRRRVAALNAKGWHVLYVWTGPHRPLVEAVADEVVAHVQAVCSDPAAVSQYRVIRGDGTEGRWGRTMANRTAY